MALRKPLEAVKSNLNAVSASAFGELLSSYEKALREATLKEAGLYDEKALSRSGTTCRR